MGLITNFFAFPILPHKVYKNYKLLLIVRNFSLFDKNNMVALPDINSALLAYETGVHIGDGSLQIIEKGTHSVRYFGHSEDDWIYFNDVLPAIIKELYNKQVSPGKRTEGKTCYLSVCSKKVALFKRDIMKLPVGNKNILIDIPSFVRKDENLLKNCLRGIADTDFSLYFRKNKQGLHTYPEINCVMSNKSLIKNISKYLMQLGFKVSTRFDMEREREHKINTEHRLTICGNEQIEKWMNTIGFYNPKQFTKYLIWKKFGFCPPRLTTNDRILILQGKMNPFIFANSYQPEAKTP